MFVEQGGYPLIKCVFCFLASSPDAGWWHSKGLVVFWGIPNMTTCNPQVINNLLNAIFSHQKKHGLKFNKISRIPMPTPVKKIHWPLTHIFYPHPDSTTRHPSLPGALRARTFLRSRTRRFNRKIWSIHLSEGFQNLAMAGWRMGRPRDLGIDVVKIAIRGLYTSSLRIQVVKHPGY